MSTERKKTPSRRKKAASPGKARARTSRTRPDEMSAEVIEFITAIDEYKREHERPFPNWSEVLEILKTLGYERREAG